MASSAGDEEAQVDGLTDSQLERTFKNTLKRTLSRIRLGSSVHSFLNTSSEKHMAQLVSDDASPWQERVSSCLFSVYFETMMTLVIVANVVQAVHECNLRVRGEDVPAWLDVCSTCFLIFYLIEITAKLAAWGRSFFHDGQNVLDFLVVLADVAVLIAIAFLAVEDIGIPSFTIIRVLKLLRLLRLLKAFKIFKKSRELTLMIAGMASTFRAIFYGLIMIFAMLLLWAIVAVEVLHPMNLELVSQGVYDDDARSAAAYSSVGHAFATLMQQVLVGDDWSTISMPLIHAHPFTAAPILIAIYVSTQLAMLNLVLTAIVDSAQEYRAAENASMQQDKGILFLRAKDELIQICQAIDKNNDGTLELEELLGGFDDNRKFRDTLDLIDVHRDDMVMVFNVMDVDNSGTVSYEEFINHLQSMKMDETKTLLMNVKSELGGIKRDIQKMIYEHQQEVMEHHVNGIERVIRQMQREETGGDDDDERLLASVDDVTGSSLGHFAEGKAIRTDNAEQSEVAQEGDHGVPHTITSPRPDSTRSPKPDSAGIA